MTGAPSTRMSWRGLAKLSGVVMRAAAATSACRTTGGLLHPAISCCFIEVGRSHEFPEAERGSDATPDGQMSRGWCGPSCNSGGSPRRSVSGETCIGEPLPDTGEPRCKPPASIDE